MFQRNLLTKSSHSGSCWSEVHVPAKEVMYRQRIEPKQPVRFIDGNDVGIRTFPVMDNPARQSTPLQPAANASFELPQNQLPIDLVRGKDGVLRKNSIGECSRIDQKGLIDNIPRAGRSKW